MWIFQYIHQITEENKYHVFWQLPQYAVMTCGEVMFSLTSLEFAFSQVCVYYIKYLNHIWIITIKKLQAPESMRAVLQALNTLTVAGGNAIDLIIISFGSIFPKQVSTSTCIHSIPLNKWQDDMFLKISIEIFLGLWIFFVCLLDSCWHVYFGLDGHTL